MFNIDFSALLTNNLPMEWITSLRLIWLKVLINEIKLNYGKFLDYRTAGLYKLSFNSQVIYLEHILNDMFDNINRGIYIDNVADLNRPYLHNKVEGVAPFYFYNNYNPSTSYIIGQRCVEGNTVYKAIGNGTGNLPSASPIYFIADKTIEFFKNKIEYQLMNDFIVMVPTSVTFDTNAMKAVVNYYKLAGKRYTIQTF